MKVSEIPSTQGLMSPPRLCPAVLFTSRITAPVRHSTVLPHQTPRGERESFSTSDCILPISFILSLFFTCFQVFNPTTRFTPVKQDKIQKMIAVADGQAESCCQELNRLLGRDHSCSLYHCLALKYTVCFHWVCPKRLPATLNRMKQPYYSSE